MPEESDLPSLKPFWQKKYKEQSTRNWDKFYQHNTTNFFKDRHWLDLEFPELMSKEGSVGLEVGCGVGNLVYPALERNATLRMFACDFSKQAITFVKTHQNYADLSQSGRIQAFVSDITSETPFPLIGPESLDFITCVFVLSAIPPERHALVFRHFLALLKPGGCICFRDYAVGDLAQLRFQQAKEIPKLEDYLYVRQDGTMSYFFSAAYMLELVNTSGGFKVDSLGIVERRTTNMKRGIDKARYFLQGVFRKID